MMKKFLTVSVFVFTFFAVTLSAQAQWASPTAPPPNPAGSAVPLNTSSAGQTKAGDLTLLNFTADDIWTNAFRLITGAGLGKVLQSDATGYASWVATSTLGLGGGGTNYWTKLGANLYPATLTDKVGIGLSTPFYSLGVKDYVSVGPNGANGEEGYLWLNAGGSPLWNFFKPSGSNNLVLHDYVTGTDPINFDASVGNVGIGSLPGSGQMLDVKSNQGLAENSAIRATYPGGGSLAGAEFGALAYRGGVWSAVYANGGSAGARAITAVGSICLNGDCRNTWPAGGGAGGVAGGGTVNYLPKWTSGTAIGNSQIFDNGTNVGIGTASPGAKLDVAGSVQATKFVGTLDNCVRLTGRGINETGYGNCYNFGGLVGGQRRYCVAAKDNIGSHQSCSFAEVLGCSRTGTDDFCNICCSTNGLPAL